MTGRRVLRAAVAVLIGMAALGANAHGGGMASDGCHNDRAAGEAHWHEAGTMQRAGPCIDHVGERIRVLEREVEVPVPAKIPACAAERRAWREALDSRWTSWEKTHDRAAAVIDCLAPAKSAGVESAPAGPTWEGGREAPVFHSQARREGMNLRPLNDRVVVNRIEAEGISPGGILLPDGAREQPMRGKVLAVGAGRVLEDGTRRPVDVVVGDEVLFGKYSGTEVKVAGDEVLVLGEDAIMGVFET